MTSCLLTRSIYGVELFAQLSVSRLNSHLCVRLVRSGSTQVLGQAGLLHTAKQSSLLSSSSPRILPPPTTAIRSSAASCLVRQHYYHTSSNTFPLNAHNHCDINLRNSLSKRGRVNSGWSCQRDLCLCQQRRTYAKKVKKTVSKLSEADQDIIDLERVESSMDAAVNALKYEYTNSIITRITPASLDKVTVEIDGEWYQLKQVAQIGMPNPQTMIINISAYPQAAESVVVAIRDTDLNLNPILEKNVIKVPIPKMTKELRERLVKVAKAAAEKSKVGVRKARQKAVGDLKKKTEVSKDSVRRLEKHIQELTDKHTSRIEEMFKAKSSELLKGS